MASESEDCVDTLATAEIFDRRNEDRILISRQNTESRAPPNFGDLRAFLSNVKYCNLPET
jgi:hypothetical protein